MPSWGQRPKSWAERVSLRTLGIDPGARRIGTAISDSGGSLASPYEVVERKGGWVTRIASIVEEEGIGRVVVGLALSLSGAEGPAASSAREVAAELASGLSVPVELWDERFSTVSADHSLRDRGLRADARRRVVDMVAAAVILQSYLDAHR